MFCVVRSIQRFTEEGLIEAWRRKHAPPRLCNEITQSFAKTVRFCCRVSMGSRKKTCINFSCGFPPVDEPWTDSRSRRCVTCGKHHTEGNWLWSLLFMRSPLVCLLSLPQASLENVQSVFMALGALLGIALLVLVVENAAAHSSGVSWRLLQLRLREWFQ